MYLVREGVGGITHNDSLGQVPLQHCKVFDVVPLHTETVFLVQAVSVGEREAG